MLAKIVSKVIKVKGTCVNCGSTNIGFVDDGNGMCRLICKDCGSDEIANLSFGHANKVFRVEKLKGVVIKR